MSRACLILSLLGIGAAQACADRIVLISVSRAEGFSPIPNGDVDAMRHVLQHCYGFQDHEITELRCSAAVHDQSHQRCPSSRNVILRELRALEQTTSAGDRVLIYFSGHGTRRLLPNVKPDEPDGCDEVLVTCDYRNDVGGIVDDELGRVLENLTGRHVVAIIDTCFSGSITKALGTELVSVDRAVVGAVETKFWPSVEGCLDTRTNTKLFQREASYLALLGAAEWQAAFWGRPPSDAKQSASNRARSHFTRELVSGLSGWADANGDGAITYEEIMSYTYSRLSDQNPVFIGPAGARGQPFLGIAKPELEPCVLAVKGAQVTINYGTEHGVDRFTTFEVWRNKQPVGDVYVELSKYGLRSASGVVRGAGTVRPGDRLRTKDLRLSVSDLKIWPISGNWPGADADVAGVIRENAGMVAASNSTQADVYVRLSSMPGAWKVEILGPTGTVIGMSESEDRSSAVGTLRRQLRAQRLMRWLRHFRDARRGDGLRLGIAGGDRIFRLSDDPSEREEIRFEIESSSARWITVFSIDRKGELERLVEPSFELEAGRRTLVPAQKKDPFQIKAPAGQDHVFAVATRKPMGVWDILRRFEGDDPIDAIAKDLFTVVVRGEDWLVAEVVVQSFNAGR